MTVTYENVRYFCIDRLFFMSDFLTLFCFIPCFYVNDTSSIYVWTCFYFQVLHDSLQIYLSPFAKSGSIVEISTGYFSGDELKDNYKFLFVWKSFTGRSDILVVYSMSSIQSSHIISLLCIRYIYQLFGVCWK